METSADLLSILLVDDDKDDRFFFQEAFKEIEARASIQTVNDGEELMNYLTRSAITYPQIIFLDLNMPRKGGLECLQEIRKNMEMKDIIIIIYSTSSSEKDISESFSIGANLYLKKPNDYFTLIKLLTKVNGINWQEHAEKLCMENFLLS